MWGLGYESNGNPGILEFFYTYVDDLRSSKGK